MGIYYATYQTSYAPYLAHHGVKGMKWGVRHDPNAMTIYGAQSKYIEKYGDSKSRAKSKYKSDTSAIRKKRNSGSITDSQYKAQMNEARRVKRNAKAEGKLNARKEYYSHVSQGRGIAGSVLLHVGGRKLAKAAQKKWGEKMMEDDGQRAANKYLALMIAGNMASYAGAYGEYLEARRAIDKHKGRI